MPVTATCDRCGRQDPSVVAYPDLWLDLHPACAESWWDEVQRERTAALTLRRPEIPPNDDDPELLRSRGVL